MYVWRKYKKNSILYRIKSEISHKNCVLEEVWEWRYQRKWRKNITISILANKRIRDEGKCYILCKYPRNTLICILYYQKIRKWEGIYGNWIWKENNSMLALAHTYQSIQYQHSVHFSHYSLRHTPPISHSFFYTAFLLFRHLASPPCQR